MKEIEKLKAEIEKEEIKILNIQAQIKALQDVADAMRATQETRVNLLRAKEALHQVNNN